MPQDLPSQLLARAAAIVVGLALLLLVRVHGPAFYAAWGLIAIALLTELLATVVYWRRIRLAAHRRGERRRS